VDLGASGAIVTNYGAGTVSYSDTADPFVAEGTIAPSASATLTGTQFFRAAAGAVLDIAEADASLGSLEEIRAQLLAVESARQWAANPDSLIAGVITRDANGAATSAPVVWPDGATGTYTATTVSTAFPGAVDAYTITRVGSPTLTYTQPLMTRDANGAVTNRPTIAVA
jgi:hypothetical protein